MVQLELLTAHDRALYFTYWLETGGDRTDWCISLDKAYSDHISATDPDYDWEYDSWEHEYWDEEAPPPDPQLSFTDIWGTQHLGNNAMRSAYVLALSKQRRTISNTC